MVTSAMNVAFLGLLLVTAVVTVEGAPPSYDYKHGGWDWEALCSSGTQQSPINIVVKRVLNAGRYRKFKPLYSAGSIDAVFDGQHTKYYESKGQNNTLILADGVYDFLQFHFHVFTEHAIDGRFGALEAHFVHAKRKNNNSLAVVAVQFILHPDDKDNAALESFLTVPPLAPGGRYTIHYKGAQAKSTTLAGLYHSARYSYYSYKGSLTTPPCSEIVQWFVLKNKQYISAKQMSGFMALLSNATGAPINSRIPKPLNGRIVKYYA